MKKIFFLAMFVTIFTACNSDDNNNEPFVNQELEFEVLLWGYYSSVTRTEQETIIKSQEELENWFEGDLNPDSPFNIDFENYQLIIIYGEPKFELRYYEIISVIEYENQITISYNYFYSGSFSMIEYQPWSFTKMPKSDKPVVFEMEEVLIED